MSIKNLTNKVYDIGIFPKDMFKSIFIALPNKAGETEGKPHRNNG